ncbi:heterokaryon incompatibility protein-domain-containing protein [Pestalotiopsis sp. NC0098]|nr:heterokaryon incompatibility protein-domain-containing protein [Pestalotiopsis sp. NC0098]
MSHFKTSATKGCELCSVIYRGGLKALPDVVATNSKVELRISKQALSVQVRTRGKWRYVDFYAMPGLPPRWNTLKAKKYLSRSLDDPQCFDRIKKWLRVCETTHNHPTCRQRAESPLPRRVITIQPTNGIPKLYLRETDSATDKYIALSHCWGGFKGCQSTTDNYTDRINGIEFASLPRTFQDAVTFALELGVFHIWIDSLCTIQGDKDDWERESIKMTNVYSNAYLVLAAASADADDKGFFTTPDSIYRGIGLESQEGSGRDDLVMHTSLGHELRLSDAFSPYPLSPVSLGPLGTRAWTLQETLLARRCIGFNQNEIAWECYNAIDCECGTSAEYFVSERVSKQNTSQIRRSDWIYRVSSRGIVGGVAVRRFHCRPLSHFADTSTTYLEWRQMIIPNYTRRQLTFPGDRLPALSALASTVGNWSGDQYLDGIWLADIKLGLAWRVGGKWHETQLPAPSIWVSPSFSWASVDGKIDYVLPDPILDDGSSPYGSVDVEVLEYSIELSRLNPYGALNSGWVKLSALSQTLKLQWGSEKGISTLTNESEHHFERSQFYPDTILRESCISGPDDEEYVSVLRSTSLDDIKASFNICVQGALILDVPKGWLPLSAAGAQRFPHLHEVAIMVLGLFSTSPDTY